MSFLPNGAGGLARARAREHARMTRRQTSPAGLALIERFESFKPRRYLCPAGKPTIGFGHVILPGEKIPAAITIDEARSLMAADLAPVETCLAELFPDLPQHQFDALASFVFNVGIGAFRKSTLCSRLRAGDTVGAAGQFMRWVNVDGKPLPGLVKRRAAEHALFRGASHA